MAALQGMVYGSVLGGAENRVVIDSWRYREVFVFVIISIIFAPH
jgi:hypothetical protein